MISKLFKCLILGPPASGKGTISTRIVNQFKLKHISSGDLLRQNIKENTAFGKEVKQYTEAGMLVPDELITKFIVTKISKMKNISWLLDGFPRTVSQAKELHKYEKMDLVINLNVPFDVIIDRVKGRWIHLASGRVYNTDFNAPKITGKDDVTGEDLIQREDDKPESVRKRLDDYDQMTRPVISYYSGLGNLEDFSGRTTNEIWPKILECMHNYLPKDSYKVEVA